MVPDPDTGPLDATMIGELWVTGASDPIGISLVPSSGLPDYGSPFIARLSVPQRGTGSFEIGLSDLSTYTDLGGAAGNQTYRVVQADGWRWRGRPHRRQGMAGAVNTISPPRSRPRLVCAGDRHRVDIEALPDGRGDRESSSSWSAARLVA